MTTRPRAVTDDAEELTISSIFTSSDGTKWCARMLEAGLSPRGGRLPGLAVFLEPPAAAREADLVGARVVQQNLAL